MTAFDENNLKNQDENLRTTRQNDNSNADQLGENMGSSALESDNPFTRAENPDNNGRINTASEEEQFESERFGENSGILNSNIMNDYSVSPGPGDDDDDLTDDDDLNIDDDEDDTLIPIEEDDEEDSLDTDDEDENVPGTDMDNDDLADDDEDLDEDTSVTRSSTSDMGSSVSTRDLGRTSGRMIDHEPGVTNI